MKTNNINSLRGTADPSILDQFNKQMVRILPCNFNAQTLEHSHIHFMIWIFVGGQG